MTKNNTCAIICEYNPLHNGHLKHIVQTKLSCACNTLICIMSGNVTQRGEFAILNKYDRARHAILAGADIVIELPTVFACGSARNFAYGAVNILKSIKCDCLSFGSECGDIDKLQNIADAINSFDVNTSIKYFLHQGNNYPTSIAKSLKNVLYGEIIDKPNNLLAIEYINAAKELNYSGNLFTMTRDDNFNSDELTAICGASAIRNALFCGETNNILSSVPQYVANDLQKIDYKKFVENYQTFAYNYLISSDKDYLSTIEGMTEGIENRIIKNLNKSNYIQFLEAIKTKRYTQLKLNRIVLNSILNINKKILLDAKKISPYIKILAINGNRLDILTTLSKEQVILSTDTLTKEQLAIKAIDDKSNTLFYSLSNRPFDITANTHLNKIYREQ